ncbi:uncharacterized protein LOC141674724 isoform X2 [Apium graveolens]|uniref:uncharacterized protein LOC141674724 isoform X2 n=1 Tax=Apium graveolens TaxID=4045 RepID=UPI003D79CCEC
MEMQKTVSLLFLVCVIGVLTSSKFGYGNIIRGHRNKSCIKGERQALLLLKKSLNDSWANCLSSWTGDECCSWDGIECNNLTGHIIHLNLGSCSLKGSLKFGCGSIIGDHLNRSCIHREKQALLLLKKGLVDELNLLSSWVGDDCCSWHKIECHKITGQVTKLHLGDSHLKGSISNSIGNLTALTLVDLYYNFLEGTIPKSIGALTSLTYLDLSNNNLHGVIPESIGNLSKLSKHSIGNNNFEGLIPKSIGALTSLANLDLYYNNFQGPILQYIANLTLLHEFDLTHNKFDGSFPAEIGNLTKLLRLTISMNQFSIRLPESFCQLTKLTELWLDDNQLRGSIPKCIGELSNLINMDLASNSWDGFVSEHHFVNLTQLDFLRISSESNLMLNVSSQWVPPFQLSDIYMDSLRVPKFPKWLITQRKLDYIEMTNASISDTILAIPKSVTYIDLSNNHLFGNIPAFLCNLTLRTLLVSDNNFSGELPQCLGNLTYLEGFSVMNNNLCGDIPVSLGSLGLLRYLNLHNNNFQGKLPLSFQNLTSIIGLDVGKNNLRDTLPRWTWKLRVLRYLIIRSNNFYGEIPTDICHSPLIQVLNMARNDITGSIPLCFGNFTVIITSYNSQADDSPPYMRLSYDDMIVDDPKGSELTYTSTLDSLYSIDLSNNQISGEIPEELMDLRGLLSLNLAGNNLSGRSPDRIGKLEKLEFLDLSRNELYGPIPQSLSFLTFLSRLNLSFNDFRVKYHPETNSRP